ERRGHAQELLAGRPRPHGRERQDRGDLRILQRDLRIRAGRCRGERKLKMGLPHSLFTSPIGGGRRAVARRVRGYGLSRIMNPLTPTLSPTGRGGSQHPWLSSKILIRILSI